jgi:hypothetical protein
MGLLPLLPIEFANWLIFLPMLLCEIKATVVSRRHLLSRLSKRILGELLNYSFDVLLKV